VRWLVDGMNVIGSRPDGWWRDRDGAVERLVEGLDRFAAAQGEEVEVVFDGRPVPVEPDRAHVRFARRGARDAADDAIVALATRDPEPATLRVVTSDIRLAERVRALGADVESAGAFRRRLDDLLE
jgi:predicted RNA-binding protein with PIN domain